jgi:hypothetical protein
MERRSRDIVTPGRRDVLKLGGLALAGACVWPLKVAAAAKGTPRGTARACIMLELKGAIHQQFNFDFKDTKHTPKDLEPKKLTSDITLSQTLFPRLGDFIDKIAFTRTTKGAEFVHFTGQYHTQAGRALNLGLAREIPAFGSVIAYELESSRKESDSFPAYVSTSLTEAVAGAIGSGFLPARFTGFDLDPISIFETFSVANEVVNQRLEQRWRLLEQYMKISEGERKSLGKNAADYQAFYQEARKLRSDPKWIQAFTTTPEEKKRYGENKTGLGCIVAKNLIAANAGTRFVYVYTDANSDFDCHHDMFDRKAKSNIYVAGNTLDKALSSLLEDLSKLPGTEAGKTLLDETLVFATSEFGRTPEMNPAKGSDHYPEVYTQFWAGGGVKGGRAIGKTNEVAGKAVDTGWNHKQQPRMDNAVATIYSALGIDWLKKFTNTPSGRDYEYVQSAPVGSGGEFISNDEIAALFE